ncbi:hypothetical protein N7475_006388 [Penicillium sp. IBT 31633x]|nr:hypothetical protein N7475_006388 [Penicillium sp. IBT 31633x]
MEVEKQYTESSFKRYSLRHTIPPEITTIIVKQQKDRWENEFKVEKEAYKFLEQLQGIVIPRLFRQGYFNEIPALILADIGGITLYDLACRKDKIDGEMLERELKKAPRALYDHGVQYEDQRLDNFLLCDNNKVMIVDLEQVKSFDKSQPCEKHANLDGVYILSWVTSGIS